MKTDRNRFSDVAKEPLETIMVLPLFFLCGVLLVVLVLLVGIMLITSKNGDFRRALGCSMAFGSLPILWTLLTSPNASAHVIFEAAATVIELFI